MRIVARRCTTLWARFRRRPIIFFSDENKQWRKRLITSDIANDRRARSQRCELSASRHIEQHKGDRAQRPQQIYPRSTRGAGTICSPLITRYWYAATLTPSAISSSKTELNELPTPCSARRVLTREKLQNAGEFFVLEGSVIGGSITAVSRKLPTTLASSGTSEKDTKRRRP